MEAAGTGPLRLSGNLLGILYMTLASLSAVVLQVLVRIVAENVHLLEVLFFRNALGLPMLLPFLLLSGGDPWRIERPSLHVLRNALQIASTFLFFHALVLRPLGEVTVLGFLTPIFVAVLAVPVLRERVDARHWLAVLLGFAGAFLALRPDVGGIAPGSAYAIIGALIWAVVLVMMNLQGRTETALSISFWSAVMTTPMSLVPALFVWTWPEPQDLALLVAIGVVGTLTTLLSVAALRSGDASVVTPFDYLKLVRATILGAVLFAESPDLGTWAGGTLIFASTWYVARRASAPASA